jgi:diacylglycerol kinase family enzyme
MIAVFVNPAAGTKHDADRNAVVGRLFEAAGASVQLVAIAAGVDVAASVRSAVARGAQAIVAGGGDGTVNSVASQLVGTTTPLGVLPLGTLNHFAKDLHIPLDLPRAVRTIVAGHTTQVDAGEVNDRIFVNNASIGVYPDIVIEREKLRRQGSRKWTAMAIATARVARHYRGVRVRIETGNAIERTRTPFVFVGNNAYQIAGVEIGARIRLDGGRLYAYLAPRHRTRDLAKLLVLALIGRMRTGHVLESFAATHLEVATPGHRRMRIAVDGEVIEMASPLHYRIRPRALVVIVPAA